VVSTVRFIPDGRTLVTAGNDGTVRQWEARSGQQLQVFADAGAAHSLAVSPDGRALASAASWHTKAPAIRVWDLLSGKLRREFLLPAAFAETKALAFSSDGRLILCYGPKLGLTISDIATGQDQAAVQPRFTLQVEERGEPSVVASAFAPGNQYLAICTGLFAHVVEVSSGDERFSCPSYAMTFTPDGDGLAVASAHEAYTGSSEGEIAATASAVDIVDIATGARKRIVVPMERVGALTFSPDGRTLAVADGLLARSIRLYTVEDGRELDVFVCPAARTHPSALAFAPDCRSLAVGGLDDTTVVIWKVTDGR
jgi:WD40 repeat protein